MLSEAKHLLHLPAPHGSPFTPTLHASRFTPHRSRSTHHVIPSPACKQCESLSRAARFARLSRIPGRVHNVHHLHWPRRSLHEENSESLRSVALRIHDGSCSTDHATVSSNSAD